MAAQYRAARFGSFSLKLLLECSVDGARVSRAGRELFVTSFLRWGDLVLSIIPNLISNCGA